MATDTLEFAPCSMVKKNILSSFSQSNFRLTILTTRNSDFDYDHGQDLFDCGYFKISFLVMITK